MYFLKVVIRYENVFTENVLTDKRSYIYDI